MQRVVQQAAAERRASTACTTTGRAKVLGGGGLRLFAVSDVHTDSEENHAWVAALDETAYQRDAVLVAGDVSHHLHIVQVCITLVSDQSEREGLRQLHSRDFVTSCKARLKTLLYVRHGGAGDAGDVPEQVRSRVLLPWESRPVVHG